MTAAVTRPGQAEVVHACPPTGGSRMPCCGVSPLEESSRARLTTDAAQVTCRPAPPPEPRPGTCGEVGLVRGTYVRCTERPGHPPHRHSIGTVIWTPDPSPGKPDRSAP